VVVSVGLAKVCASVGFAILAAGDHFNDLPMLDGRFAAYPCCPSNAIPQVRDTVLAAGGHIASQPAANGVAESWHFFHAERAL
jgi:hydroxymethylpyrimidine pyrophosphatase-like HAD family hydrolase